MLPQVRPFGEDADVFVTASTLLDSPRAINERTKNLGEALTVGHARKFRKANIAAEVLMDDTGGVRWALDYKIPVRDTVWVLSKAIEFGEITTKPQLRSIFTNVSRHAQLPKLAATGLLDQLRE